MTRSFRMFAGAALLALFIAPRALAAQEPELGARERAAVEAAEAWLALMDAERYEESWQAAAPLFQSAVTSEMWVQQGRMVRQQIGAPRGRKLQRAEHTTSLPNVPAGEYVVVLYAGSFANIPEAREVVILMLQPDESWRTAGYFVQPPGAGE
ncbi:MAG TPA: DUF4019 domain-containing protein [Longimicrobiales bacterium]|nr:DUF4019 domain-containing protein [Longimicrobiales bacterium]